MNFCFISFSVRLSAASICDGSQKIKNKENKKINLQEYSKKKKEIDRGDYRICPPSYSYGKRQSIM